VSLEREDVEAVAKRVVQLLEARPSSGSSHGLVDAATMARLLGVSRATIYARAEELGAIRVGKGKRARLRFDPSHLTGGSQSEAPSTEPRTRRRRSRKSPQETTAGLLPIRGGRTRSRGPLVS
jgi:hypothetical protein